MNYYIEIGTINKAKQDIDTLCQSKGFCNLTKHNLGNGGIGRLMTKVISVGSILFKLKKEDMLLLQYPMKKFYKIASLFAHWKGAKVVTIIHDLGAFRRKKLTPQQENKRLSHTDFLIVHNQTMREHLIENGYQGGIHNLDIFDYLSEEHPASYKTPHTPWKVIYAGNLGHRRNEFLYHMDNCAHGWEFELYGKGFEEEKNTCQQLHYHGFMPSDQFIREVQGDFGLVWDGDSLDACTGAWGEYLKINNPHKTSFYLRAGIPVIVWSKAAMAPFIKENNCGIVINSINDLDGVLAALSETEYAAIRNAAARIGERLAQGYYFTEGVNQASNYIKTKLCR